MKVRPEDWRVLVKHSIRLLIIARNGIRSADMNGSILGLMWEYMLSDEEISSIVEEMVASKEMGSVAIDMGRTRPEVIYTLPYGKVTVVNNYVTAD